MLLIETFASADAVPADAVVRTARQVPAAHAPRFGEEVRPVPAARHDTARRRPAAGKDGRTVQVAPPPKT
jgi:hypothetical protein